MKSSFHLTREVKLMNIMWEYAFPMAATPSVPPPTSTSVQIPPNPFL